MSVNSAVDLALVADVQAYLGGTFTTEMNTEIQSLITALSQACANYCSRAFMIATYTEVRNGRGTGTMFMKQRPIRSVASIAVNRVAMSPASAPGAGDGFTFNETTVYATSWMGCGFVRGLQNIVVNYTAGYYPVDATSPACDIPADLRQSIVEAVADRFKRRSNVGILAKGIAGETITYGQISIPKSVAMVWDTYAIAAYAY